MPNISSGWPSTRRRPKPRKVNSSNAYQVGDALQGVPQRVLPQGRLESRPLPNHKTNMKRFIFSGLCVATTLAVGAVVAAQQLPDAPAKGFGTSITPAYEGWYDNPDGSHTFLIGYYNRNVKQAFDIPVGPNNHVDPGGPD